MTFKRALAIAVLLIGCMPGPGAAAVKSAGLTQVAGRYMISASSNIGFVVEQVGGGGIRGRFGEFSGSFDLKPGNLSRSMVSFELLPESVTTGQTRIDEFLRSGAVFDAARYERIVFRSSRVEQTGADTARVTGIMTAKGHSSTEMFDVRLVEWGGRSIRFDVRGRIFRSRYDMDVGTPIYSNVVQFDMRITGQRR